MFIEQIMNYSTSDTSLMTHRQCLLSKLSFSVIFKQRKIMTPFRREKSEKVSQICWKSQKEKNTIRDGGSITLFIVGDQNYILGNSCIIPG